MSNKQRKLDLFVDVESRQKQAEALRRLAAMVEAGEVFAVVSIVVARDTEAGPVSEASDWRDVGQPELASPARAAFVSRIIAHHCLTLPAVRTRRPPLWEGAIGASHKAEGHTLAAAISAALEKAGAR